MQKIIMGACILIILCSCDNSGKDDRNSEAEHLKSAQAIIEPKSGSKASGTAIFKEKRNGIVEMVLTLRHIAPGKHAVHIHTSGDCSGENATSAGGHWNPGGNKHGKRGTKEAHRGDIGNIIIEADSTGTLVTDLKDLTIGGPNHKNIIGHALVVHEKADDFTTQPSGTSGSRIGCGVIKAEKDPEE